MARLATCHKCNKRNHFEKVCEPKSIHPMSLQHSAEQAPIPKEYSFSSLELNMDKVECSIPESPQPNHTYPSTYTSVRIYQCKLSMQIDSGAEDNIIDEETFAKLKEGVKLKPTNAKLSPYNSPPVQVEGKFQATVRANGRSVHTTIYITAGHGKHSLMSHYMAFDLGILSISLNEIGIAQPLNKQGPQQAPKNQLQPPADRLQHISNTHQLLSHAATSHSSSRHAKGNQGDL